MRSGVRSLVIGGGLACFLASGAAPAGTTTSNSAGHAPLGPTVTIDSGPHWSLTGWRSSAGLCVAYQNSSYPLQKVRECGVELRGSAASFSLSSTSLSPFAVVGAVTPRVTRAAVRDARTRERTLRIFATPARLKTTLRFFYVLIWPGRPPRWQVSAYDARGKRISYVGQ
jgi:hypothetical protein